MAAKHHRAAEHAMRSETEKGHEAESLRTIKFEELWRLHPKEEGARGLASRLGGQVGEYLQGLPAGANDSAIRLSIAFNESGHFLRESDAHSGKRLTDSRGNIYITHVAEFKALLTGRHGLGEPTRVSGKDVVRRLATMSGIILFEDVASLGGAGHSHIDLWHGAGGSSDTATTVGHTFLSEAGKILFWPLEKTHLADTPETYVP